MTSEGKIPPPPPPPPSVPSHAPILKLKVKPGQDAPRNDAVGLPPMKSSVLRDNLDVTDGLPPIRSSVSKVNLDDPKDDWGQKPYLKQTKPGFVKRMRKFFLGKNKKKKKVPLDVELR